MLDDKELILQSCNSKEVLKFKPADEMIEIEFLFTEIQFAQIKLTHHS